MGTSHEAQYTFLIISRSVLLRIRSVSHKICRQNRKTHFTLNNPFIENCAVCEMTWKNIVQPDESQIILLLDT